MTAEHILRNLSDGELISLIENGSPSASELELIRRYDALGQNSGLDRKTVSIKVNEAKGCYPREDFLSRVITSATSLVKRLRGDNKEAAQTLASELQELANYTNGNSEYGISELDDIFNEDYQNERIQISSRNPA